MARDLPKVGDRVGAIDGPGQFPRAGLCRTGTVTEIVTDRWYTFARVQMDDGRSDTCHGLTTVGIGWYALEKPEWEIGNTYRCACRVCPCYSRVDTRGIRCDLCMWGQHAEPAVIPRETCTRCGAAPVAVDLRDAAHALGRPREALCRSCYLSSYGQFLEPADVR